MNSGPPITHFIVYSQLMVLITLGLLAYFDEMTRHQSAGIGIMLGALNMAVCYAKAMRAAKNGGSNT